MKRIVVLHFNPIELYPPMQNLLAEMSKADAYKTFALSTRSANRNLELVHCQRVKTFRFGLSGKHLNTIVRYATYVYYNLFATLLLALLRPSKLIYFETLSSFPAFLYKKYINPGAKIYVHYHEYTSTKEYKKGMITSRFFHQLERKLYHRVEWLSHTNEERMQLFLRDVAPVQIPETHIMPNYPPLSWASSPTSHRSIPIRLVYIGSLGMKSMFVEEFSTWVVAQNGNVVWDIYSVNCDKDVMDYFEGLNNPNINFKDGVSYKDLPHVLRKYDVGIILYNGHILNYVHVAPNKLFEYLACGLDVWFPDVISGSLPYASSDCRPKVIPLDFNNLNQIDLDDLSSPPDRECSNKYFAEFALMPLMQRLHD